MKAVKQLQILKLTAPKQILSEVIQIIFPQRHNKVCCTVHLLTTFVRAGMLTWTYWIDNENIPALQLEQQANL